MVIVASPAFLETWGNPLSVESLAAMPFARYALGGLIQPVRLAGKSFVPTGRVDCDSGAALIQAALAGLGAAYLLRCLVTKELQAGALVTLGSEIALPSLPFNALHAFGRTVPSRVKLFCDFIAREARAIEVMYVQRIIADNALPGRIDPVRARRRQPRASSWAASPKP